MKRKMSLPLIILKPPIIIRRLIVSQARKICNSFQGEITNEAITNVVLKPEKVV